MNGVLERIVENWLDKASEKSFQKVFCHMLSKQGFTIIHLTRHCAMELGKDILAIAPDGIPCAYQLKGSSKGKIGLSDWRNELNAQVFDLVTQPIIHSSIDQTIPHRSFLVTNCEFEEEVNFAIDGLNRTWQNQNLRLETIVRGQMFEMAMDLEDGLWPSEADQFKLMLEIFLEEGDDFLNKKQFSIIFEKLFKLEETKRKSKPECSRLVSSGALLTCFLLNNYTEKKNYYSEIEGWTLFIAHCYSLCKKNRISTKIIKSEINIANQIIYNALFNLGEEIIEREHLVEGNALVDQPILQVRVTLLISLMSILWLWRRESKIIEDSFDEGIRFFLKKYEHKMQLWGEACIPQYLAYFWFLKKTDATPRPDFQILVGLINTITNLNKPSGSNGLANPYYQIYDILPYLLKTTNEELDDSFNGTAFFQEGLLHLVTRRLWKQTIKMIWPAYSKIAVSIFEPKNQYSFYRWICREGTIKTIFPILTKNWKELKNEAAECQGNCIPDEFKNSPVFLLLFCNVYPHRMNSEIIRWLDTNLLKY